MRFTFGQMACGAAAVVGLLAGPAYAQQYTRVSVATDGTQANSYSHGAVISPDGRFVAFSSAASNLVPGDTDFSFDVFVRDLVANTTTRVSLDNNGNPIGGGWSASVVGVGPAVSGFSLSSQAKFVAFASTANPTSEANLCPGGTPIMHIPPPPVHCTDIWVRDLTLNHSTRITRAPDASQPNERSGDPRVSADGQYVLFGSRASNLVPGDTNGAADLFLWDRLTQTTSRVSLSSTGTELPGPSWNGRISADGQIIAFMSASAAVSDPDPVPCVTGYGVPCARAYVLDRGTGALTRVPLPANAPPLANGASVLDIDLTPDGRFVVLEATGPLDFELPAPPHFEDIVMVYDRQTGRVEIDVNAIHDLPWGATINASGRIVSLQSENIAGTHRPAGAFDRPTRSSLTGSDSPALNATDYVPRFTPDGLHMVFESSQALVPGDTNNTGDIYILNRDLDNDGMPDAWETRLGLDPTNPADGAPDSDADGDGVSNLQEYLNGTHPKGTFKRYFAEGAANSFFTTRFALFNPNDQPTNVILEFLGSNSQTLTKEVDLPAHGWGAITLNDTTFDQPGNDFSTIVESDRPVVADRTMSWDKSGYGSHAETSIEAPATTWFLAEGATHGSFDLFYLLQNPGDTAADVTVTYLLPAGAPIIKHYAVPAKTRKTIHVDEEDPGLAATDVSATITSDERILVERSMYYSTPSQAFAAGHEGAAVKEAAFSWFFAEGATGSFFDLFLLLANPSTDVTWVRVKYLLPSGDPIVKTYLLAPQSRKTINVDFEDPRLIDTPVSMIVETVFTNTTGSAIVAERAMWWPSPDWYEAHLSAGATTTGTTWALAEGLATDTPGTETQTFILLANTSTNAGSADVTLYFGDGSTMTKNFPLEPSSRTNVWVNAEFPGAVNKGGFGTIIQSNGVPIVVERSMYSNANGQTWAAGTDALATKLH